MLRYAAIAVAAAVVLVLFLGAAPRTQAGKDREVIAACWKDQGRKSLDPGAARFAAGACEMLEQRFREAHGAEP